MTLPFVSIVGCPRSGTSATHRWLNVDNQFMLLYENDLPALLGRLGQILKPIHDVSGIRNLGDERGRSQWEYISKYMTSASDFSDVGQYIVQRVAARAGKDVSKIKYYGDKLPEQIADADKLLDCGYLVVCVLRNPYSVINSMRVRALNTIRGRDGWHISDLNEMCKWWNIAVNFAAEHVSDPRVHIIDHGQLIEDAGLESDRVRTFFHLDQFHSDYRLRYTDPQPTLTGEVISYIDAHCAIEKYFGVIKSVYHKEVDLSAAARVHRATVADLVRILGI